MGPPKRRSLLLLALPHVAPLTWFILAPWQPTGCFQKAVPHLPREGSLQAPGITKLTNTIAEGEEACGLGRGHGWGSGLVGMVALVHQPCVITG